MFTATTSLASSNGWTNTLDSITASTVRWTTNRGTSKSRDKDEKADGVIEILLHVLIVFLFLFIIPPLRRFDKVSKAVPEAFAALHEMSAQFRTDSGSSLRDVVNRLDRAAENSRAAAEDMKINVHVLKSLADQSQVELQSLLRFAESNKAQAQQVATDLAIAQSAVEGVAADLADAHERADAADHTSHGAAADAASKSDRGNGG
jgi:methyl-accepting chemotaxis protein